MEGCQWIGPDQDPQRHNPIKYCGAQTVGGRSYCGDHIWRVYQKGTSINGKRAAKVIDDEIAALAAQQEIDDTEAYNG
jgi:hypothetical protein